MTRRRRIVWTVAGGVSLLFIVTVPPVVRSYEASSAYATNSPLALMLTALNTRDRDKAGQATYRLLSKYPKAASVLKRAALGPLRPRTAGAVWNVVDHDLQRLAGEFPEGKARLWEGGYEQALARLKEGGDSGEAQELAGALVFADAERAKDDLARLDAATGRLSLARLRMMNDEDLSFARALVRQKVAQGHSLEGTYAWLADKHPTLTSRLELDRLFRSVGQTPPKLDARREKDVREDFAPQPLATLRKPWRVRGRAVATIVADLDHPLLDQREIALRELAATDPARAAPILARMLRGKRTTDIWSACFDAREVAPLRDAARHPDWQVRKAVARRLFEIGTLEARAALEPLKRDPVRFVREAAVGRARRF